jgi:hypothetical protein
MREQTGWLLAVISDYLTNPRDSLNKTVIVRWGEELGHPGPSIKIGLGNYQDTGILEGL